MTILTAHRSPGLTRLLALLLSLSSLGVYAQISKPVTNPVVPPSPDAASLGKFGEIPVSAYTGVPDISVPIYTVKSRDITVPISLHYHASGIKVQEDAGWVGIGWALRAGGAISRTTRGRDDLEYPGGFIHQVEINNFPNQPQMNDIGTGTIDSQPDLFNLDVAGISVRFVLPKGQMNGSGGFLNNQYLVATILNPTDNTQVRLKKDTPGNYVWEVTTPDGMVYNFGIGGREVILPYGASSNSMYNQPVLQQVAGTNTTGIVTAWNLTEIVSPLYEHVTFNYNQLHKSRGLVSITEEYQKPSSQVTGDCLGVFTQVFSTNQQFSFSRSYTQHAYLTAINFANGSVVFDVTDDANARQDINPLEFNGAQKLNGITVKNSTGVAIRKWLFSYDYFQSTLTGTDVSKPELGKRLRLDAIKEVDAATGTVNLAPHQFFYRGYQNGQYQVNLLPPKNSQAYDEYGYFNGYTQNDGLGTTIPNTTVSYFGEQFSYVSSVIRSVVLEHAQKGTLEKIVYPTGGSTTFTYQTHQAVVPDNSTTKRTEAVSGTTPFTLTAASSVNIQANLSGYPRTLDPVTGVYSCTNIYSGNINVPATDPWLSIKNSAGTEVYVLRYSDVYGLTNQASCDFQFSQTASLPAGVYTVSITPHNNAGQGILHTANAALYTSGVTSTTTLTDVGGLRVSNITHTDGVNTYAKSYTYIGGKVMSPVKHMYPRFVSMAYSDANGSTSCPNALVATFTSWNIIPAGNSAQGSYVGYDNVAVADLSLENGSWVSRQGKKQYYFINRSDSVATASYFVPNYPLYPNVGNGSPLQEQTINAAGATMTSSQYQDSRIRQSAVKGFVPVQTGYSNVSYLSGIYTLVPYTVYSDYWKVDKVVTQEANLNGTASLTTTTQNTYNNSYRTLEKVTTDNSQGQLQDIAYTYPYSSTVAPYPTMIAQNRVNTVIDEVTNINSVFVKKTSKPHSQFTGSSNIILPSQLITRRQGETADVVESTYGYDLVGNLASVVRRDGTKEQYTWYTDAARKNYLQNQTVSQSDGALARTTTFDYEPLIGLKSITDPNSLSTSYEYDEFKRLKTIKDNNQNLVKTFHYNYGATGSTNTATLISPNFKNIVIIGNSITRLVAQNGTDGWQSTALSAAGGWGRAASIQGNDFAHILEKRFQQLNPSAKLLPLWEAPFERDYINPHPTAAGWLYYDFAGLQSRITNGFGATPTKPDLVIIRLGENVLNSEVEPNNFKNGLITLINSVTAVSAPGVKIIMTNSMWPDQPLADAKILEVANEQNLPFVSLSDMIYNPVYLGGNDPATLTQFPLDGSDRHPGDVGMLEIADRIWGKLFNETKQVTAIQPSCPSLVAGIVTPSTGASVVGTTIAGSSGVTMPFTVTACVPAGQTIGEVAIIASTTDGSVVRKVGNAVAISGSPGSYSLSSFTVANGVSGGWLPATGGNFYTDTPPLGQAGPLSANGAFKYWAQVKTADGSTTVNSATITVTMSAPVVNNVAIKARILTRPYSDPTYVNLVMSRYGGGTFLGTNDLNSPTSVTLAVIPATPVPSPSSWIEYTFSNTQAYRYLMYKPGVNSYGELAELEFYSSSGKLDGAKLGSTNVYPATPPTTYTFTNAFDGITTSFWNGSATGPTTNWIAIDLGTSNSSCPSLVAGIVTPSTSATLAGTTIAGNSGVTMPFTVTACVPAGQTIGEVAIIASTVDGSVIRKVGNAVAISGSPGSYSLSSFTVANGVSGGWLPGTGGNFYTDTPPLGQAGPLSANGAFKYWAQVKTADGSTTVNSATITVTMSAPVVNNVAIKARILTRPYSDAATLTTVMGRYTGGTFYGTNDLTSTTPTPLAIIPSSPTLSPSSWVEYPFNNTQTYRYLLYKPGGNSYGELAELEFYSSSGKLDGAKLGSSNTYNFPTTPAATYTYMNAFDGITTSFWNGSAVGSSVNWIAIDLGSVSCTIPTAPVITTSAVLLCSGQQAILTATGCSGTVTWSTGQTGLTTSVTPTSNTNYTATCTVNGCVSTASNQLTISVPTVMPATWTIAAVGTPPVPGCANRAQSGSLIVRGVGNVPGTAADAFPYVYKTLSGDVTIIAKVAGIPTSTALGDGPRVGIIVRNSAATNASFVWLVQEANGVIGNYRRTVDGGAATFGPTYAQGLVSGQLGQAWIKLVKVGSTITSYYSMNANPETNNAWILLNIHTDITLGSSFLVGFTAFNYNYGVTGASNNTTIAEGVFTNVTVNGVSF